MEMKVPYYIVRSTANYSDFAKVTEYEKQDRDGASQCFVKMCEQKMSNGFKGIIELLKVEDVRETSQGNIKDSTLLEIFESNGLDDNKNHVMRYKCYGEF